MPYYLRYDNYHAEPTILTKNFLTKHAMIAGFYASGNYFAYNVRILWQKVEIITVRIDQLRFLFSIQNKLEKTKR